MRAVSFVDRLEFKVTGIVCKKALTLGDVDNDKASEIAVGCMNGDLFIFKGMVTSPWRHASDLGMITCVVIGDVLNQGQNVLVVVTGDGLIHLFCLLSQTANAHKQESEAKLDHCISQESSETILPTYTQKVPANIYIALLADIDGDGQLEFVVAMTDRVVRSYRWRCTSGDAEAGGSGCLVAQHKWEMFSQIGSVDVNSDEFGRQYLMVSQPGGTYVSLVCKCWPKNDEQGGGAERGREGAGVGARDAGDASRDNDSDSESLAEHSTTESQCESDSEFSLEFHPLGSSRARNSGITTEIVGNINHRREEGAAPAAALYATAVLDGTLALLEEDKIKWSIMFDHQLIGLTKMDMTGDGNEEVVVCSWDGQTYIVDYDRKVVRFQFAENVCAFIAGQYSTTMWNSAACLVYATFNNNIYLYHNILMPQLCSRNLLEVMEKEEGLCDLLSALQVDSSSPSELKQLYRWCLYGQHPQ